MKTKVRKLLTEVLPAVDFDSDFLFTELDSLGVATILMVLCNEFGIQLGVEDVTPKNFKSLDSLVSLIERKLNN